MKLITAIIRPVCLESVQDELRAVLDEEENYRLTVESVEGHGRQAGRLRVIRGREIRPQLVGKLRLTIATNDDYVERAIEAITRGARTGEVGDGIIFVTPIESCVRIRTGDRDSAAV